jgi:2-polyprenyl-3-methyl-5-hydroxy-6-metoxy-1,4-benzoquinol methylase
LQSVPFETNANDDLFDTDILLQAAYSNARVEEVTLTKSITPFARLTGVRQAVQIAAAVLQFKAHRMGMLCSLKLRRLTAERYRDKTELPYSSHSVALKVISNARPSTVLDIGCGPGHVAARCRSLGVRVTGIDLHRPPADSLTEFISADLEADSLPADVWDFDAVLLLDVIEHLADPEKFLLAQRHGQRARPSVGNAPLFVISTPNVAFIAVRLNLLFGRFNYAERGILDITHKRLFTRRSLLRLLSECGYHVERCHAVGAPFAAVVGGRWGRILGAMANGLARLMPTLFAFQFLVECRPHPGARQLLDHAIRLENDRASPLQSTVSFMTVRDDLAPTSTSFD